MKGLLACVVVASGLLSANSLAADSDAFRTAVTGILTEGWAGNDFAMTQAEAYLARAKAAAPQDFRAAYAYALAQLKARRFKEAQATLDELVRTAPSDLKVYQARIWLMCYLRDYPAALTALRELAARLPEKEADSDVEKEYRNTATFLGRLFGFLAGPAPDTLADSELNECEQQVKSRLTSARRVAFDDGRREVMKKFAESQVEKKQNQDANRVDEAKRKADDLAKIPAERAAIDSEQAQIEKQVNSAKAAFNSEENKLRQEMRPLKADHDRLSDRAKSLQRTIDNAERDADRKDGQAKTEKDKGKAQKLRNEADRLRDSVKDEKRDLAKVRGDANKLEREYNQLEAKLAAATHHFQQTIGKLNAENSRLLQKERVIGQREREDKLPATGETGNIRSMEAKLSALATYIPLLLDEEKERILNSLK